MKGKEKAEEWRASKGDDTGPVRAFLKKRSQKLAEQATIGVLGTLNEDGYPYTSVVELIFDGDDNFWLLLSNLAQHTRNFRRDVRASILIRDEAKQQIEPLAMTRGTYLGRIIEMDHRRNEIQSAYLEVHPHAEDFIKFSDFRFYRFRIEKIRLIAGFGKMGWVDIDEMGAVNKISGRKEDKNGDDSHK